MNSSLKPGLNVDSSSRSKIQNWLERILEVLFSPYIPILKVFIWKVKSLLYIVCMCAPSYAFTRMCAYTGIPCGSYVCPFICIYTHACLHWSSCGSYVCPFICIYMHACLHWSSVGVVCVPLRIHLHACMPTLGFRAGQNSFTGTCPMICLYSLWNSDTWRNWINSWKVKRLSGKISTE